MGTAPGSYYILFAADNLNLVTETNETNNVSSVALTVIAPTVDLSVSSAYTYATTILAGNSTSASCYLDNQGNAPATPANMGFYLSTDNVFSSNDVSLGSQTATTLSGGGYLSRFATITVATSTTAGTYYVLFVADPLNLVTETSETNNVTSISRAATPLLVLSQGSFSNKNEGLSLPLHGKTTHTIRFDVG
jgi:subtilase family serine protease